MAAVQLTDQTQRANELKIKSFAIQKHFLDQFCLLSVLKPPAVSKKGKTMKKAES